MNTVRIPEHIVINPGLDIQFRIRYFHAMRWIEENPFARAMRAKVRYHLNKRAKAQRAGILYLRPGLKWD